MSDDLLTMPGMLLPENEARHEIKPGCECLACERERLSTAHPGSLLRTMTVEEAAERFPDLVRGRTLNHTRPGLIRVLPIAKVTAARTAPGPSPHFSEPIPVTEPMREAAKIAAGPAFYAADEKYDAIFRARRALEPSRLSSEPITISDEENYRLIAWPKNLPPPYFDGQAGSHTIAPWSVVLTDQPVCDDQDLLLRAQLRFSKCSNLALEMKNAELKAELEDALRERNVALIAVIKRHAIIAAKDARIAELKSELALLRRAACDDPVTTPANTPTGLPVPGVSLRKISQYDIGAPVPAGKPSPFRDFPTDPRRMGP